MALVSLPLLDEHVRSIAQFHVTNLPYGAREQYFIVPPYVYDDPITVGESSEVTPVCWLLDEELTAWLHEHGLTFKDVKLDVKPITNKWKIFLPEHIAVLYKLTWL